VSNEPPLRARHPSRLSRRLARLLQQAWAALAPSVVLAALLALGAQVGRWTA
jgi:hypothetical protein